jgi:hypothetical protein
MLQAVLMHFDEHRSWLFQQLPHLVEMCSLYWAASQLTPKALILYGLLLKKKVICRKDLTVTPGVSPLHRHVLVLPLQLFCNGVPAVSWYSKAKVALEKCQVSLYFGSPVLAVPHIARYCAGHSICLLLNLPKRCWRWLIFALPPPIYRRGNWDSVLLEHLFLDTWLKVAELKFRLWPAWYCRLSYEYLSRAAGIWTLGVEEYPESRTKTSMVDVADLEGSFHL